MTTKPNDHGIRLRPGIYKSLKDYLGVATDREFADRLGVSLSTMNNAKAADKDPHRAAPILFISAATRVTGFPMDSIAAAAPRANKPAA